MRISDWSSDVCSSDLPQRLDSKGISLAESPALAELIEQVRERSDLVILDTPPVLPVDEARVIASMADGAVFLVRWPRTPSTARSVARRRRCEVHAEMLGAVLPRVDVGDQGRGRSEHKSG